VRLHLKNIGGLAGEHVFEFNEGVNEVIAPNAAGKTTIIKTLLALLNPSDENVRPDVLLNQDADEGYVKLILDGEEYYRVFRRQAGRVVEVESKPLANDERFSWLLLDPYVGKLVAKVIAGEEDITDFIDLSLELSKLRERIQQLRYEEEKLRIKRGEVLEKSKELANLIKEREERGRKLEEKRGEVKKIETERIELKREIEEAISNHRRQIGTLQGRLDSYRKESEETAERIKDIEAKIQALEEEVSAFYLKHPNPRAEIETIDREIDSVRSTIRSHEERLAELKRSNPVLADAVLRKPSYCPVCGQEIENPEEFWKRRATELEKAIREIEQKIDELSRRETELLNAKGTIEREWATIRNIEGVELPSLKNRLQLEKSKLEKLREEIGKIESQIKVLEERIRELEAKMPEEERKRIEELAHKLAEVNALEEYLKGINERIRSLGDVGRELEAVEKELAEIVEECRKLENHLYELRREVVLEFREVANSIIKKLGFTWFKSIALDEDRGRYLIRVVRVFPSGREDKQVLRQLSTSERVSVALIAILTGYKLGILARYPQSKLIVLADEALLAFDPERFNKVVEELKNYGKYVVVTKLAEPSKIPALTIVHR